MADQRLLSRRKRWNASEAGVSETRYAEVDGAAVAYRTAGSGSSDVVSFFRLGGHVDAFFDEPAHGSLRRGLMNFGRLVGFDRRGLGAADRPPDPTVATPPEGARDALAVMDAVASERAVLFAGFDAGPAALQLAATCPERIEALVLSNTFARFTAADDYPIGVPASFLNRIEDATAHYWGTEEVAPIVAGRGADRTLSWRKARQLRSSATPRAAARQLRTVLESDVRPALTRIDAPVLVLHITHHPVIPLVHGRHLASALPNARFVEVEGDSLDFDRDQIPLVIDEMAHFLTGHRLAVGADLVESTLLVSDIVDSTPYVARLGDRDWRRLLDAHDQAVRVAVRRTGGDVVNTTGDGFLGSFTDAGAAVRCAHDLHHQLATLGLTIRVGLHSGIRDDRSGDLSGLAVHIATRVAGAAEPGEVLVTDAVLDTLDTADITVTSTADVELRGVPGRWRLSALAV